MFTLSAPCRSGYKKDFDTKASMFSAAADLLGVQVEDMIVVEGNFDDYFYASQDDADADEDGAYAVQSPTQ